MLILREKKQLSFLVSHYIKLFKLLFTQSWTVRFYKTQFIVLIPVYFLSSANYKIDLHIYDGTKSVDPTV